VYTGGIGFASPVAGLELSVAIRTFEQLGGRLWLGAGGGIVADSDPEQEFEEALIKAGPLVAAIGSRIAADGSPIRTGAAESVTDDRHDGAVSVR
jgi:para-aminobenzoate synthetase/4-amino-4-deoxychorismate lyase